MEQSGVGRLEPELSYSFSASDLELVLDKLVPIPRYFDVRGHHATIPFFARRKAVHFFGRGTSGTKKERVRVWREHGVLIGCLDLKDYVGTSKYEKRITRVEGEKSIVKLLKTVSPLVSALVKDRISVHVWWDNDHKKKVHVTIGIDRFSPISLADPTFKGDQTFHLEVEGDGTGSEVDFVNSSVFKEDLSGVLLPLQPGDTKWLLAKAVNVNPHDISDWSARSLRHFFSAALDSAEVETLRANIL